MTRRRLLPFFLFGSVLSAQPSSPPPLAAPLRELPWGQLNFLHTTDIHGWWGGHLQEPSFSADWGDYISFAKHLRDRADADGSDLLLIDTGDRIEGNAIYDSSKPRGKFTYEIAKEQSIDLICSGNHELYKAASADGEFYHTVPDFAGNYLASNLDIINPNTGKREPLAPRFKKFATKNQGIRILAFGFIFDFTGNDNNTFITRVADTVKESWFRDAISDEDLDLILVYGHVDIRSPEYALLYQRIRTAHPTTPIQFFGGHSHIRDYHIFDTSSVALESGRYMETLGFMSISGLRTSSSPQDPKLTFQRRYIDNNLYSLHHHSSKNNTTFPTPHGVNVTSAIGSARQSLSLNHRYGCAPRDLWVSRRPYPHPESIFTWLATELLPQSISPSSPKKKAIVLLNTGGIRFDIFKGPFTKDTKFLVSPFTSGVRYIKNVPWKAASRLLGLLNNEGPIVEAMSEGNTYLKPPEHVAAQYRSHLYSSFPSENDVYAHAPQAQKPLFPSPPPPASSPNQGGDDNKVLFPGYTTYDDAGTDGDDTIHTTIPFYAVPNCIQATINFKANASSAANDDSTVDVNVEANSEMETVDVMYNEFIEKWILLALEFLGEKYSVEDTRVYKGGRSFTDIMTDWVEEHWHVDGECPT
ncbi:ser/Thr protein phosphatase-like protein family [Byssothecium circinans]|uniref:Ser/Thr protein phosphatase-like protein family n=1 Tax=Byssothecium circinans TaxID=147558 RepID=A0A6A5U9U3_9PLEO|nr:ser/Thr protein phosphatase-like protein family [Byssothecium circinans]